MVLEIALLKSPEGLEEGDMCVGGVPRGIGRRHLPYIVTEINAKSVSVIEDRTYENSEPEREPLIHYIGLDELKSCVFLRGEGKRLMLVGETMYGHLRNAGVF